MPSAISVEELGKCYKLSQRPERYIALRDVLAEGLRARFRRGIRKGLVEESFWALRDISFSIETGDVVGIIGRNGAGKSTLLKLLSRITDPTTGRIKMLGRVASLLEVGTGFHPELTGRENIYLNGAILGMSRVDVKKRFDEIVEFAGVERFLETPVKRYSSGMYMRLAFSVAAHLEPDIMVVDEVLSVGDAEFQKKCLGRMRQVSSGGRTVLFVSHNLSAVAALCRSAIWLDRGRLLQIGPSAEVLSSYVARGTFKDNIVESKKSSGPRFRSICLRNSSLNFGEVLAIDCELFSDVPAEVSVEIEIHDERGAAIAYTSTAPMYGKTYALLPNQPRRLDLKLGPLSLAAGEYSLYFWLIRPWAEGYDETEAPLTFVIEMSDPGSLGFDFRQDYGRGAFTIPLSYP